MNSFYGANHAYQLLQEYDKKNFVAYQRHNEKSR